jgi:hypothetical protein
MIVLRPPRTHCCCCGQRFGALTTVTNDPTTKITGPIAELDLTGALTSVLVEQGVRRRTASMSEIQVGKSPVLLLTQLRFKVRVSELRSAIAWRNWR